MHYSTGSEDLTSILKIRKAIEHNTHKTLRDLFAQHVFVGVIDECRALIQHGTRLYLCETSTLMREVFYQHLIYNFGKFGHVRFSNPMSIYELALLGLDMPETGWTPDDEAKPRLAHKVTEILTEKGEMLKEYFSVEIDENGYLKALPLLLNNHTPELPGLPLYLLRLTTELDWDNENEFFEGFCRETATYYAQLHRESCENWEWVVEHVFYSSIKESFLPPKYFTENAAVLELADLPNLYKVFERC